jgi:hypothetical protein
MTSHSVSYSAPTILQPQLSQFISIHLLCLQQEKRKAPSSSRLQGWNEKGTPAPSGDRELWTKQGNRFQPFLRHRSFPPDLEAPVEVDVKLPCVFGAMSPKAMKYYSPVAPVPITLSDLPFIPSLLHRILDCLFLIPCSLYRPFPPQGFLIASRIRRKSI